MGGNRVIVEGLAKLPVFCHAVVADNFIYVSGTLGTKPNSLELVEGGTGPQTIQAMQNIAKILSACGATLKDVIKMNVFLTDINTFDEMNQAYMEVMGSDPPARITVGCAELALHASVEIDCVAYKNPDEKRP